MMIISNTTTTNYNNSVKVDTAFIEECGRRYYELALIYNDSMVVIDRFYDVATAMVYHCELASRFEDVNETEAYILFKATSILCDEDDWED